MYRIHAEVGGAAGPLKLDLQLTPTPNGYFPPVQLREADFISGYVVPGLVADASGTICLKSRCSRLSKVPAYHDHNWGVWRDVTWEWGNARGSRLNLLYGGVYGSADRSDRGSVRSPFFMAVLDSLGVKQVLRFQRISYHGSRKVTGNSGARGPEQFDLQAVRDADTLNLRVRVLDALGTAMESGEFRRVFLQMRGRFTLAGRLLGQEMADSGSGFFETYVTP
jgi:hypothetical protein